MGNSGGFYFRVAVVFTSRGIFKPHFMEIYRLKRRNDSGFYFRVTKKAVVFTSKSPKRRWFLLPGHTLQGKNTKLYTLKNI
jgi:hypothetical protein